MLATEQQGVMYKPTDFLNRRIALSLIEASSLTLVNYRKFWTTSLGVNPYTPIYESYDNSVSVCPLAPHSG